MMISFQASKEDHETIARIVDRALMVRRDMDRLSLNMDLTACHANGHPLNLEKLLKAPDFDFAHDVFGIVRHIDRDTGKLTRCFSPRCTAHQPQ